MKLQNAVNVMLFEQSEDEWVKISPEDYIDLLDVVGGYGSRIKKIKGYKDKKIWITGTLNVNSKEDVKDLEGIDYIDGDLNIAWTNIPYFDKEKVKGYFRYSGSKMDNIEREKIRKMSLQRLDALREKNAWDINNGDDTSIRTEALYTTIDSNGTPAKNEDKYFILPQDYGHYGQGQSFTWLGENDYESEYVVYTRDEADEAAERYVKELIDELGMDAFSEWLFDSNIDYDYTDKWLKEYFEEVIYQDPDGYGVPLALSSEQQRYVDISKERIKKQQERIKNEQLTDEKKQEIEDYINELDVLIEDIEENPEGDYDDDAIDDMAQSYADDERDNILDFLKDMGYDSKWIVNNFIKVDGIVEDLIQSDGYGFMSSYDGDYSTEYYDGEDYIVIRTN
jgi:hypothetical protein